MVEPIAAESVGVGVERIALRTPTLPPATHTNSYLVGAERFYVVEPASPWPDEQRRLEAVVSARLRRGHSLIGAIITHHHVDHVGGARELCDTFGVPLLAHVATREKLGAGLRVDALLDEGTRLDPGLDDLDIEVLHTPGHAPGHLCLRSRAHEWIIVGDMIASEGTILIDPEDDGDMDAYITQLRRLASLNPTRLLPAHGDPIDDARERLDFYVAHRLAREARVLAAVTDRPEDLDEIAARAYSDTPFAPRALAARSAAAHLERLARHGQVALDAAGQWRRRNNAT